MKKENRIRNIIRKPISALIVFFYAIMFLPACAAQNVENTETWSNASEKTSEAAKRTAAKEIVSVWEEAELERERTLIDFPFPDRMHSDGYTLALVCMDASAGTYELRLYDKEENIVQQFTCEEMAGAVSFFYNDLTQDGYADLEIFSSGSQSLLLFVSDAVGWETGKLFQDEVVEIPTIDVYDRILVSEEDETCRTETIYGMNKEQNNLEALAGLKLHKEDGILEIWDYLDNRSVYEGKAALQEDGSLVNEEYYQYLFRGNLYRLWQASEDSTIRVWVSETEKGEENGEQSGFEWAQKEVFGNIGHTEEYENRQTFLSDFGFADKEPFYQYYDNHGNLQLELYLDEESGKGGGLVYQYHYTYQLEKVETAYGFVFDMVYQGEWKAVDPYILTTVEGSTGEDEGREYEEIIEYTEAGRIDYYKSMAFVDWIGEKEEKEEKDKLLEINYIYRDDGTLCYRDYSHNSIVFETTFCGIDSYYDELGRVVYESGYITHGSYEEYYIYEDNGKKPAYYLSLDDNLGYNIPTLVRFH